MTVAASDARECDEAAADAAAEDPKAQLPMPTYRSLAAPISKPVDKFALLPAFLKVRGLVKEHIDSFNYFITKGIRNIVKANNRIEARNDPSIYLRYTNIRIGTPSVQVDFKVENITPHFCRLTDRTPQKMLRNIYILRISNDYKKMDIFGGGARKRECLPVII